MATPVAICSPCRTPNTYRSIVESDHLNMEDVVFRDCSDQQMSSNFALNGHSKMAAGDSDDETFEDAVEGYSHPPDKGSCPGLDASIEAAAKALDLFLNNHFNDAMTLMKQWSHVSMYHALGKGTVLFMQAVLTLEASDIEAALEALHQAVDVCNSRRRRNAMAYVTRLIRGVDFNCYTEEEVHAELCYAECLLLIALLTFVSDQSLVSFVKGGLRIRSCYNSYKECMLILEARSWENTWRKQHFESGVKMGVGAFNLMISQLPTRILKLLEFIGFSGNRTLGIKDLEEGYNLRDGIRSPLCALILVAYHTMVTYIIGNGDGDIKGCEQILREMLPKYPKGALWLFFHGRLKQIQGKIDSAISTFHQSISTQSEWRQFHYLCHWELLWCYSFKCDWYNSGESSNTLRKECRWSPAVYTYVYGTMLYMQAIEGKPELMDEIDTLYKRVPTLKQRLAGKSLPIEKFVVRKTNKYYAQNCRLIFPALELMYVWNSFPMIGNAPDLIKKILNLVDTTLPTEGKEPTEENVEDFCLALLLRGMCLKHLRNVPKAQNCFKQIMSNEKMIEDDMYLVPFAMFELGLIELEEGRLLEARTLLDNSRHNYHGYPLETILHFRVHSAMRQVKGKGGDSTPSTPVHAMDHHDPFEELKVGD